MAITKKKGNKLVDLKAFRENVEKISKNESQNVVEEKSGLPNGRLTRLYNGYDPIHIDDLVMISRAYHCSIDYLLGGGSDPETSKRAITARDVCRMLAEIFDNFHFRFSVKEKTLEDDANMETYRYMYDGVPICKCSQATMMLPAELKEYNLVDENGEWVGCLGTVTAAQIEINNFIARYATLEKIDKLDADMKKRLVQSYLSDVSEDASADIPITVH